MRDLVVPLVREDVQWLRLSVELTGAVIVALGVGIAATQFVTGRGHTGQWKSNQPARQRRTFCAESGR